MHKHAPPALPVLDLTPSPQFYRRPQTLFRANAARVYLPSCTSSANWFAQKRSKLPICIPCYHPGYHDMLLIADSHLPTRAARCVHNVYEARFG